MSYTEITSRLLFLALLFGAPLTLPAGDREKELLDRIQKLEARVAALEALLEKAPAPLAAETPKLPPDPVASGPLSGTTFSMTLDGYYSFNFNSPVGRTNLLRAYDVLSNNFSLNQAAMIVERAPDPARGRRFGARVDLQYGQATEALQGSAANEPRPQVYRPIFQAYGTYVAPVGSGLTVDFGKWASALGVENNYTKDQFNYSRSYLFNFLPYYHFGFRSSYNATNWLTVSYWLVNGVGQSEDFNGFKSQAVLATLKPAKNVSWSVNYYSGNEDRDGTPDRRLHIVDSYVSWQLLPKLSLVVEADYVTRRGEASAPRVVGGAAYARYSLSRRFALAGRAEDLSDRGGLFSGVTQNLKEVTVTTDYRAADGFLVRGEWRRDFSGRAYFLTDTPGRLKREQNTATLGLIWWFGGKQGSW